MNNRMIVVTLLAVTSTQIQSSDKNAGAHSQEKSVPLQTSPLPETQKTSPQTMAENKKSQQNQDVWQAFMSEASKEEPNLEEINKLLMAGIAKIHASKS